MTRKRERKRRERTEEYEACGIKLCALMTLEFCLMSLNNIPAYSDNLNSVSVRRSGTGT